MHNTPTFRLQFVCVRLTSLSERLHTAVFCLHVISHVDVRVIFYYTVF